MGVCQNYAASTVYTAGALTSLCVVEVWQKGSPVSHRQLLLFNMTAAYYSVRPDYGD